MRTPTVMAPEFVASLGLRVRAEGHAVVYATPDPTDTWPPFAYTVGLWKTHQHPELLISALPRETASPTLDLLARRIARGESFAEGAVDRATTPDTTLTFVPLPAPVRFPLVGCDVVYADAAPPVLQVLYTDANGRWPWQHAAQDVWRQSQAYAAPLGAGRSQ